MTNINVHEKMKANCLEMLNDLKSLDDGKPRGRPRLGPNNTRLTDDKQHYRDYHRTYYRENLSKQVECPLCNRMSTIQKLARHQKTDICSNRCRKRLEEEEVHHI